MSGQGQIRQTHIEHNASAVAIIADMRADMGFLRSGPFAENDDGKRLSERRQIGSLGISVPGP